MAGDRLAELRELERADEAVAAALVEADELYAGVEDVRGRAHALLELADRLPAEREAAAEVVTEADRQLADARAAAEQAAAELRLAEAGGNAERAAEARRFDLRARDSLHMAERRAVAAQERAAELEARAAAAERDGVALEQEARELGGRLADEVAAEPGAGPARVAEWGTEARAALLVSRSRLAAERDAVVRQAHELGAAVLGEDLPPLGAREVVRHVESTLGR
jgi:hypothetical protein